MYILYIFIKGLNIVDFMKLKFSKFQLPLSPFTSLFKKNVKNETCRSVDK